MTKKLFLGLQTVEDGGLLIHDKVYPEKQYVFTSPRGFYEWLCQQMGTNAKPDSHTYDGRVVTSGHKLEKLERLWDAVNADCDKLDKQGTYGRVVKYGPILEIIGRLP